MPDPHHMSPHKTFLGVRFLLLGFDPSTEQAVRSKLVNGGGVDVGLYNEDCTHVIVDKLVYDDPVCAAARDDGKTLVTGLWVDHSYDTGMPIDASSIMYRPLKDLNGIRGAKSIVVCLTGYQRQDRDDIMTMVGLMGAHFSKPLVASRVTHLVCYKFEGEKYELAKKLNTIKLINHLWLQDCLREWEIVPEANYSKSGYELEIMEAEAKDSDEETENISVKQPTSFDSFQVKKPIDSSAPAVMASTTPAKFSTVDKAKGILLASENNDTSNHASFLYTVNNNQLGLFDNLETTAQGNTASGKQPEQFDKTPILNKAGCALTSMSASAGKCLHPGDTKFSPAKFSREVQRKSAIPEYSGAFNNANGPPERHIVDQKIEKKDQSNVDYVPSPQRRTHPSHEENFSDILPPKRKMDVSNFGLKSPKMSYDFLPSGFEIPLETVRTERFDDAKLGNDQVEKNKPPPFCSADDPIGDNNLLNVSSLDNNLLKNHLSLSKTMSSEAGNNAPRTDAVRMKTLTSVRESGAGDCITGNLPNTIYKNGAAQKLEHYAQGSSLNDNENSAGLTKPDLQKVENGNSISKQCKRNTVVKKSLGSKPKLSVDSSANRKGSLCLNRTAPQTDAAILISGGEDAGNNTDKFQQIPSSVVVDAVAEIENGKDQNVATQSLNGETKALGKSAAVSGEKNEKIQPALKENVLRGKSVWGQRDFCKTNSKECPSTSNKVVDGEGAPVEENIGDAVAVRNGVLSPSEKSMDAANLVGKIDDLIGVEKENIPDFKKSRQVVKENEVRGKKARGLRGLCKTKAKEFPSNSDKVADGECAQVEENIDHAVTLSNAVSSPVEKSMDAVNLVSKNDDLMGVEKENIPGFKKSRPVVRENEARGKKARGQRGLCKTKANEFPSNSDKVVDSEGVQVEENIDHAVTLCNLVSSPVEKSMDAANLVSKSDHLTGVEKENILSFKRRRPVVKAKKTQVERGLRNTKAKEFPSNSDKVVDGEGAQLEENIDNAETLNNAVSSPVEKSVDAAKLVSKIDDFIGSDKENLSGFDEGQNRSHGKHHVGKVMVKHKKTSEKTNCKPGKNASPRPEMVLNRVTAEPVCFIVSGHRLQRKDFQKVIKCLKGKVCRDSHQWSYQATHFIAADPLRRTEKFFAAAASGRWILKTDYLSDCNQEGKFLSEEPYEWYKHGLSEDGTINLEAPRKWRLLREKTGHGAFYGMQIIIYGECIAPPLDTLKRVVKAGDGTILATAPPYSRFLSSGVDFAVVSPSMASNDIWVQEFLAHQIPCVVSDYLVEYVCKPGYSLEKHVLHKTHAWAEKSFANMQRRSEEIAEPLTPPSGGDVACQVCGSRERGEVMLICGDESGSVGCGFGTHIDCCDPPLESVPEEDWFCWKCSQVGRKRRAAGKKPPFKRK